MWHNISSITNTNFEISVSASHHVSSENGLALHVLEAEFTDVEAT